MALIIRPLFVPSEIIGQPNGRLPESLLVNTPAMIPGGPVVTLCPTATRAWRALTAAAASAGHHLLATDSYRPYADQVRIFTQRYTRTPNGQPCRMWGNQCWYKKPGVAAAAIPGTSNHGKALAVDGGENHDGDPFPESWDKATLQWLFDNAISFGWSWELQSEPWHIRYFTGDRIPQRVLAYEKATSQPQPKPPPQEDDEMPAPVVITDGASRTWALWVAPASHPRKGECLARVGNGATANYGGNFAPGTLGATPLLGPAGQVYVAGEAGDGSGRIFTAVIDTDGPFGDDVNWSSK